VPTARATAPPPLPGATPLFDAAALRRADRLAGTRHAMPSILLMERAGLAAAEAILAAYPQRTAALVVVGAGNNGGDGYVVARHLAEAGWDVAIAAPRGQRAATPDASAMAAIARSLGLRPRPFAPGALDAGRLVVDGLLGTGARGAPRGTIGTAVAAIARSGAPVVSLDVPSGVDADTGVVAGEAIRAELTVTFHGDMPGLHVEPGRSHAGRVMVADIGIPVAVASDAAAWLVGRGAAAAVPPKAAGADKYASGAVLLAVGSPGLTGAGCLASRATLRAGAGLTVAGVPAGVQPVYATQLVEIMSAPIPEQEGAFGPASVAPLVEQAQRVSALVIGPGIGRAEQTRAFVREALEAIDLPAVVDADALHHLGTEPGWLALRSAPTVLTPHAGEAGHILDRPRTEVEAERLAAARALTAASGAVAVLKGPGTVVAAPDGRIAVGATGSAALATAGTGDVLSGVVGAFLAKGMEPFAAAAAAVAVHGRAGELAGRGDGTVAGDVVEALPAALAERDA